MRLTREDKLIKITRGLYEDDPEVNPSYLAIQIYNPSYLSFDYALYITEMLSAYWSIGRLIVEDEQKNQDDGEADKKRRVDQFFCFYDNNFCFCTQKKQSFRYIILINLILRQRIYD